MEEGMFDVLGNQAPFQRYKRMLVDGKSRTKCARQGHRRG
jgi:hypothetical protein